MQGKYTLFPKTLPAMSPRTYFQIYIIATKLMSNLKYIVKVSLLAHSICSCQSHIKLVGKASPLRVRIIIWVILNTLYLKQNIVICIIILLIKIIFYYVKYIIVVLYIFF